MTLCRAIFLVALLASPSAFGIETHPQRTHVVYAGQRLGSIAKRYGISVEAIRTANDLGIKDAIKPGQRLLIPATNDRDGTLARGTVGPRTRQLEPKREPVRPSRARTHRVERGQRMDSIARRYGVSVEALRSTNGIGMRAVIRPGQVLKIPDDSGRAVAPSEALAPNPQAYFRTPRRKGYLELYGYKERFRGFVYDKKARLLPGAATGIARVLSATGTRPKLNPRLFRILVDMSDAFGGRPIRIVSGYRAASFFQDSRHKDSRAIDFSIPGVPNSVIRDYLRTLSKVGVGYYPNSSFVHLDAREYAAYWVDYAGPGQAPRRRPGGEREPDDVHEEEPADVPGSEQHDVARKAAPQGDGTRARDTTPDAETTAQPESTPAPTEHALPESQVPTASASDGS